MSAPARVLLVEDSPQDAEMILKALETHLPSSEVRHLRDGAEALDFLYRREAFVERITDQPALIMLDLKMPKVDGFEVLRQVKGDPALRMIPVVVMTSSREEQDLRETYQLGVNAYVVKPVKSQNFVEAVKQLGVFWSVLNEPPPGSMRKISRLDR